jgi:hypothetical protein
VCVYERGSSIISVNCVHNENKLSGFFAG